MDPENNRFFHDQARYEMHVHERYRKEILRLKEELYKRNRIIEIINQDNVMLPIINTYYSGDGITVRVQTDKQKPLIWPDGKEFDYTP